jgi:sigma-B regulation protein RsbU (phosphoserine phosphatase)
MPTTPSGFASVAARLIAYVGGAAALLFIAAILYSYSVSRGVVLEQAEQRALLTAEAQANDLEEVLVSVEEGTRLLASTLEHTTVSRPELEAVIESFVAGNPRIFGSAAAVAPELATYAPYFHRQGDEIVRSDLSVEEYRYWERDWYRAAVSSGQTQWSEPYFDEGGGNVLMVTYSVPVWNVEGPRQLRGVVTADLSLDWLNGVVESEEAGFGGYAVILSREGRILAHPDPELRDYQVSALEVDRPGADPKVREVVQQMVDGRTGFEPFDDLYLRKRARAAFRPIGEAGWSFAVVYPEDALLADVRGLARDQLLILGLGLVALVGLVALLSRRVTRPLTELSASAAQIATGNLDVELPPIDSRDEVGALTGAFHHMRDSLKEYIRNLEITTKAKERLESELAIARRIQMDMLPAPEAGGGEAGYELAATLVPARDVGGDLYDHFLLDGKLVFVVGDVSGKGVGPALFMARAKTMIQAVAPHEPDLARLVETVNRGLCQDNEQGMFVTLIAGILDPSSGELVYAGAGHDPPVLRPGAGGPPRFLDLDGGPVLGLIEAAEYRSQRTRLSPGDELVLYTDGVSEALDVSGDFYTAERLLERVGELPRDGASELTREVLASVKRFAGAAPQSDDITVMTVRFAPPG